MRIILLCSIKKKGRCKNEKLKNVVYFGGFTGKKKTKNFGKRLMSKSKNSMKQKRLKRFVFGRMAGDG